ncbi:MAG TPA: efflux RND transporter permease subunit, partial [Sulfurimonas sp.]|nr:efflux RND transporter permease subunit [Sulfurimonas sp.]
EIGGEDKTIKRSIEDFQMAVPFAILCIYFVLVLLFDSMTQPLIILAAIPFAIAGVIYTFFFWGMDISFFAGIGLLGLIGIVVNDSLIMVSHLNNLSSDKELTLDIIVQGSTDRLRAVILTTITTVAGMTPTIFGFGGSEPYLIPLVLAVVGGLVFATIITLVLVPTLYSFRIKKAKKAS